jgi:hypothetical protein
MNGHLDHRKNPAAPHLSSATLQRAQEAQEVCRVTEEALREICIYTERAYWLDRRLDRPAQGRPRRQSAGKPSLRNSSSI